MCAEWIGNWAPSVRICVRPHYRAELLLVCSRPCRCQVWPSVQNYDRPLPKLSTHYTQQGSAWKPLATSALQTPPPIPFFFFPPFVMERPCRGPRLRCCGRVKGRRLCPRSCWGERMQRKRNALSSYLRRCPLPAAVSAGGRSSPGGRTACVSSSPAASPCSTGSAPETHQTLSIQYLSSVFSSGGDKQ